MCDISGSSFTTQLMADFWGIPSSSSSSSEITMTSGELELMEYRETDEVARDDRGGFQSELKSAVSDMCEGGLFENQFKEALNHNR